MSLLISIFVVVLLLLFLIFLYAYFFEELCPAGYYGLAADQDSPLETVPIHHGVSVGPVGEQVPLPQCYYFQNVKTETGAIMGCCRCPTSPVSIKHVKAQSSDYYKEHQSEPMGESTGGFYSYELGLTTCKACHRVENLNAPQYMETADGKALDVDSVAFETCSSLSQDNWTAMSASEKTQRQTTCISPCVNCVRGKSRHDVQVFCQDCLGGRYQDSAGQAKCKGCQAGQYEDQTGEDTSCKVCPIGFSQHLCVACNCSVP